MLYIQVLLHPFQNDYFDNYYFDYYFDYFYLLRIFLYLFELNYFSLLKNNWRKKQKLLKSNEPFQIFWDSLLHDGVAEIVDKNLKNRNPLPNSYKNRISEVNKISTLIAKDLKKENIYFAGIDFIDQKLNGDINVTSPTGLKTFFDLSGINLAKTFWKELKV